MERALSAFHMKYTNMYGALEACSKGGVAHDKCLDRCLDSCDGDANATAMLRRYRGDSLVNTVHTQLCGNFLINHLTPTANVTDAIRHLKGRFHVIVDIAAEPAASMRLVRSVLGWHGSTPEEIYSSRNSSPVIENVPHRNTNPNYRHEHIEALSESTLKRLKAKLADEIELYEHAIGFLRHHDQACSSALNAT